MNDDLIWLKNTSDIRWFNSRQLYRHWITLCKVQKIRVISRGSENTFSLLQWLSMRKHILKVKKIKTFVPKIILHNYILYKGDPTYVAISPVYLRMDLIFTDFPTGSGSPPCAVLEICKYLMHPWVNWRNCHVGRITLV